MSNTELIIPERSRDLGNFMVGRLLPFRRKRTVGPFIFIDHMGPSTLGPGNYLEVDQHPHIGLATLTYLLQGSIAHHDSLGSVQIIEPGSVNWMVAGKGISHTERTPAALKDGRNHVLHGYQIWVALPEEHEQIAPSFHHFEADALPQWEDENLHWKLVAGEAFGRKSPVPCFSPMFMLDLSCKADQTLVLKGQMQGEIGICVVEGSVHTAEQTIEAGNLLVSKEEDVCELEIAGASRLLFFGGQAFGTEPHIYWNFVSHSKERIEEAKKAWAAKDWPRVPNDHSYVPLPSSK